MRAVADLTGKRVMVVEDEFFIADDAVRDLVAAGAEVAGPYAEAGEAMAALDAGGPDLVVLDIALRDGRAFALAETLVERGVPFVFATGYDRTVIPRHLADVPYLQKPVDPAALADAIRDALPAADAPGPR